MMWCEIGRKEKEKEGKKLEEKIGGKNSGLHSASA
jgi:hypothetical protein